MDLGIWFLRALALLLAFGAGWSFGRAIPSWRIDRMNEDVPSPSLGRYGHMHGSRGGGGNPIYLFMNGAWGTLLVGIAALILAYFGWSDALLLARPVWVLALAVIAGYVVSRLKDKGPMGPLG